TRRLSYATGLHLLSLSQASGWKMGSITFFPGRGLPVRLVIFLFVSQVTGVHSHSCLDFLLGHLHSVIKDLEESLRLLIFCQPAEKGVLEGQTHRVSTLTGPRKPHWPPH
uniref:Uncharacterized protein n=1 Tax=Spermophilus dauricus TaxID=99837 RepID=A0A8C9NT52_SPEDA